MSDTPNWRERLKIKSRWTHFDVMALLDALDEAERLLASIGAQHLSCEDGWYSCPKHPDYFGTSSREHCYCWADEANVLLARLRAAEPPSPKGNA